MAEDKFNQLNNVLRRELKYMQKYRPLVSEMAGQVNNAIQLSGRPVDDDFQDLLPPSFQRHIYNLKRLGTMHKAFFTYLTVLQNLLHNQDIVTAHPCPEFQLWYTSTTKFTAAIKNVDLFGGYNNYMHAFVNNNHVHRTNMPLFQTLTIELEALVDETFHVVTLDPTYYHSADDANDPHTNFKHWMRHLVNLYITSSHIHQYEDLLYRAFYDNIAPDTRVGSTVFFRHSMLDYYDQFIQATDFFTNKKRPCYQAMTQWMRNLDQHTLASKPITNAILLLAIAFSPADQLPRKPQPPHPCRGLPTDVIQVIAEFTKTALLAKLSFLADLHINP